MTVFVALDFVMELRHFKEAAIHMYVDLQ